MKTLLPGTLTIGLVLLCETRVLGVGGDLCHPSLSFRSDTPPAVRTQVMKVVSDKKYGFIRGSFVNWSTRLIYGGDTQSLSEFIAALSQIPGHHVKVSFSRGLKEGSWETRHHSQPAFKIIVNLNAKTIDLEKLVLPVWKVPDPPSASTRPARTPSSSRSRRQGTEAAIAGNGQ